MIFTTDDNYLLFGNFIDEAMFVINSARPISFQICFQRFGFASAVKRIFGCFGNPAAIAQKVSCQFLPIHYIAQRHFGERQRFSLKLLLIRHDYIMVVFNVSDGI